MVSRLWHPGILSVLALTIWWSAAPAPAQPTDPNEDDPALWSEVDLQELESGLAFQFSISNPEAPEATPREATLSWAGGKLEIQLRPGEDGAYESPVINLRPDTVAPTGETDSLEQPAGNLFVYVPPGTTVVTIEVGPVTEEFAVDLSRLPPPREQYVRPAYVLDADGKVVRDMLANAGERIRLPGQLRDMDKAPGFRLLFSVGPDSGTGTVVSGDSKIIKISRSDYASADAKNDGFVRIPFTAVKPGKTEVTVKFQPSGLGAEHAVSLAIPITVARLDMVLGKVPEDLEEKTGAFVKSGDLLPIQLAVDATATDLWLRVKTGHGNLVLWEDRSKTRLLNVQDTGNDSLEISWKWAAQVPKTVYLQATAPSPSLRNVEIEFGSRNTTDFDLSEIFDPDQDLATDTGHVTAVDIRIREPRIPPDPPEVRALMVGLNNDNDNGQPARTDYEVFDRAVPGEDDLLPIVIEVMPFIPRDEAAMWVKLSAGLALWGDAAKSPDTLILHAAGQANKKLKIDGTSLLEEPPEGVLDWNGFVYLMGLDVSTENADGDDVLTAKLYLEGLAAAYKRHLSFGVTPRFRAGQVFNKEIVGEVEVHVVQADIDIDGVADAGDLEFTEGGVTPVTDNPYRDDVAKLRLRLRPEEVNTAQSWVELAVVEQADAIEFYTWAGDELERLALPPLADGANERTLRFSAGPAEGTGFPRELIAVGTRTAVAEPAVVTLSYLALDWNGKERIVHRDRIKLATMGKLILRPLIITALSDPAIASETKPLEVFFEPGEGAEPVLIQDDPKTKIEWLGKNPIIANGLVQDQLRKQWNKLRERFKKYIPDIDIAKLEVSPDGTLTVLSPGINVIMATYDNDHWSNPALVLSGFKGDSLELEASYATLHPLNELARQADINWMVLRPDEDEWWADKGRVALKDITFKYLGSGKDAPTVKYMEIREAIKEFIDLAGIALIELGPVGQGLSKGAKVLFELATKAHEVWLQSHIAFKSENVAIVKKKKLVKVFQYVQAGLPGSTHIVGTLDLGDLGVVDGKLPVLVLPNLESVAIESSTDQPGKHEGPIILGGETGAGKALLTAYTQALLAKSFTTDKFELLIPEGELVSTGYHDKTFELGSYKFRLAGEIVAARKVGEKTEVDIKDLWVGLRLVNTRFGISGAESTWSFGTTEVRQDGDDGCFSDDGHRLGPLRVKCETFGLLFDYVVYPLKPPSDVSIVTQVEVAANFMGKATSGLRKITVLKHAPDTPDVPDVPDVPADDSCHVAGVKSWMELDSGRTTASQDGRFKGSPYGDLLRRALAGTSHDQGATSAGDLGPNRVRGAAGRWSGGWAYFFEFPVKNAENCRLDVDRQIAKGRGRVPSAARRQNSLDGSWPHQATANYRAPDGEFDQAIVYLHVIDVAAAEGGPWQLYRLSERVSVEDTKEKRYRYTVPHFLQLYLDTGRTPLAMATQSIAGAGGSVGAEFTAPRATDVVARFRSIPIPDTDRF